MDQPPRTVAESLLRHIRRRGEQVALTFLSGDIGSDRSLTYAELDAAALAMRDTLRAAGASGEPVLIACRPGLEYVIALLGCFLGDCIAVPANLVPAALERARARLTAIATDAGARVAVTTPDLAELLSSIETDRGAARVVTVGQGSRRRAPGADWGPAPDDCALLQYTSGTTSGPKGVVLAHAHVAANLEMIRAAAAVEPGDTVVSWLPPYHDMGLVGGILAPLYAGAHGVLMPSEAFLRKPRRWLQALSHFRATISLAPNFAFDTCVERLRASARTGLDLSSLRVMLNGAEPINPDTMDRFCEVFGPYGFRREAFYPCYGMAEATLIISGGRAGTGPVVRAFDADALERDRAVLVSSASEMDTTKARRLVGCGRALLDEEIRIVEPQSCRELPARQVGEIWVKSRSVAQGYWNKPEETAATFDGRLPNSELGPFLRTGDLGFFDEDGELFITGRLKDLIIIRGRNHYPQDIERTVQSLHPGLLPDAGAAFSVEREGAEELVVVQEVRRSLVEDVDALLASIAQAIRDEHEIAARSIVLIKKGSMLKTSSGKVQRRATRRALEAGELTVVRRWDTRGDDTPRAKEAESAGDSAESPATHTRPSPRARQQRIADWLCDQVASRVGRPVAEIDLHAPLAQYGVDSLMAAEITEDLEAWLGTPIPTTMSYDNPTIADLSRAVGQLTEDKAPDRARRRTPLLARPAPGSDDPIAIVGMACRFPGASDLAGYWRLLRHGVDAVTEVPADRWDAEALYDPTPGTPGKMYSKWGGFLDGIDQFDASFFGISRREAERMDPQQRLFLEVAWEALEDAGQAPTALAGTPSGVFAAVCTNDYALLYGGELRLVDVDYGTGNSPSIVANRLSYLLDLKGPSRTVDAACASSLVALHDAGRSLLALECDLAIVGGVNAVLAPEGGVYFSQARALARDGRCKSFDQRADGFVRSEGCGVIVLKRLSRAQADGDRVYALLAGSAVNHSGRSNGLMAPNGLAQQDVLRRAWTAARVAPHDIDYVEAHGVGAPIADAVELRALGAVLEGRRLSQPLLVGSAKTNLGHLEAASGMASVIKSVLALVHEEIPPHLHLNDPHPDSGLSELPIEVPTVPTRWKRSEQARHAGVSAFGFGGTNAHVVLREAPQSSAPPNEVERRHHLFTLSAKSEQALRALARRLAHSLRDQALPDVCYTANAGRAHFAHRLVTTATTLDELRERLQAFAQSGTASKLALGHVRPGRAPAVALAFDDAPVPPAIAHELHRTQPIFRQTLERAAAVLREHFDQPILPTLLGAAPITGQGHADACLLALHYALHELWRTWGIEPAAVYGRGAGEYAAAAACGVLPWEQALVLAARRGFVLEGLYAGARQRFTIKQFKDELARLEYLAPSVPLVAASRGRAFAPDEVPGAEHWQRHLYYEHRDSDPEAAAAALAAEQCDVHLPIGPPGRTAWLPQGRWLASLRGADSSRDLLDALGQLYLAGVPIDWTAFDAPYHRQKLALPTYPFQRERHWLDFPQRSGTPVQEAVIERPSSHPLISRIRIRGAAGTSPKDGGQTGEGQE